MEAKDHAVTAPRLGPQPDAACASVKRHRSHGRLHDAALRDGERMARRSIRFGTILAGFCVLPANGCESSSISSRAERRRPDVVASVSAVPTADRDAFAYVPACTKFTHPPSLEDLRDALDRREDPWTHPLSAGEAAAALELWNAAASLPKTTDVPHEGLPHQGYHVVVLAHDHGEKRWFAIARDWSLLLRGEGDPRELTPAFVTALRSRLPNVVAELGKRCSAQDARRSSSGATTVDGHSP